MTEPTLDRGTLRRMAHLRTDFARWADLCFTILDKRGELRPLALNKVQRALYAIEREERARHGRARYFVLKGRQGGVTTYEQARNLHAAWRRPGVAVMTLAHTRDDTDKVFGITTRAVEHFPPDLLPQRSPSEAREVVFPALDSRFWTGTAGARRVGRGLTLRRLHGSEFAFWNEPKATLNRVGAALEAPGTTIALETTASAFGSEAHDFWLASERGVNGYRAVFFPWWDCDAEMYRDPLAAPDELGTLEPDERVLVERHGLDLEQVKWRRRKMREMGRSEFLNEYAEDAASCWLAGGSFYDSELLKRLMARAPEPCRTELGGTLALYAVPEDETEREDDPYGLRGERVVMGSDTAEGVGGDRSTFVARAFPSWRLVATFADPKIPPDDLAGVLNTWGRRLTHPDHGPAFLVVEKNGHGITTLRKLKDEHRYPALFRRETLDKPGGDVVDRLGWHTSAESVPRMLDAGRELLRAADEGVAGVPSRETITDAFGVARDPETGKVSLSGRDLLVADILAWLGREQMARRMPQYRGPVHFSN